MWVNFTQEELSLGTPVGRVYNVIISELPGRRVKALSLYGRSLKGTMACFKPGIAVFLSDDETAPGNPALRLALRSRDIDRKAHLGGGLLALAGPLHLNFGAKRAARAFIQNLDEATTG